MQKRKIIYIKGNTKKNTTPIAIKARVDTIRRETEAFLHEQYVKLEYADGIWMDDKEKYELQDKYLHKIYDIISTCHTELQKANEINMLE